MKNDYGRLSGIILILSCIVITVFTFILKPHNILSWDVMGYYLYLPLIFIYHDLGITDIQVVSDLISQYELSDSFYQAWLADTGYWVIKYTAGEAILLLPFFLIAHLLTIILGFTPDGFSIIYEYSILVGCLTYVTLSLVLLRKILKRFFDDKVTAFTLCCIIFGTNYFIQVSNNPADIHFILFFLYTILIEATVTWHERPSFSSMLTIAVSIGLIIITRPTDIICILIPTIYGIYSTASYKDKVAQLKKHGKQLFMAATIVAIICLIQLRYWKFVSGHWLINSYNNPGEGMDFLNPHIWQVLFSFRKGWYIYTPLMLLGTIGIYFIHRFHREIAWPITLFFASNLYLVACWSCWWYASSFGQRAFIQSYPLMAIAIGSLILATSESKMRLVRIGIPLLMTLLIALNLFQSWQYRQHIIHPNRMTRKAYFANFGVTKYNHKLDTLLLIHRSTNSNESFDTTLKYKQIHKVKFHFEDTTLLKNLSDTAHSGHYSYRTDSNTLYTPPYKISYNDITRGEFAWVKVSAWVYPSCSPHDNPGSMVITFNHKGGNYKYRAYDLENLSLQPHQWNKIQFIYLTPEPRSLNDQLHIYYWHRGKRPLYIDDLSIEMLVPAK